MTLSVYAALWIVGATLFGTGGQTLVRHAFMRGVDVDRRTEELRQEGGSGYLAKMARSNMQFGATWVFRFGLGLLLSGAALVAIALLFVGPTESE